MTRSMKNNNANCSNFELLPIFCYNSFKLWASCWSIDDWSSCLRRKRQVTTHKISVEVCFKNVFDLGIILFSNVNVWLYFAKWIDDRNFSIRLNVISPLSKTTGVNLFYFHIITITKLFQFYRANLLFQPFV